MPELPEVETIKRDLSNKIVGLKIRDIEILNSKTFEGNPKLVEKRKVSKVWRRAKVLGIDLDNSLTLLFHLKMSGQLVYEGKKRFVGGHPTRDMRGQMPIKSTRVIFTFSDNSKMYFNDQRKFGWIKALNQDQIKELSFLKGLGPEPLEKSFTVEILKSQISKRKNMPVKVALIDQTLVSGVGNIYASEACFNAKLDPRKKVEMLTDNEYKLLHRGIIKALEDGIKYGGASRTHFVNAEGDKGFFLDYAYVYNRTGDMCKRCGGLIKKITLGGRGTFFCASCQQ